MRITGGTHRGRKLIVPRGDLVRPSTDKVRQAVFNMLLSYGLPEDATVIDAFCGSGSWGLEALSRGARHCTFLDKNRTSVSACKTNVEALGLQDQSLVFVHDLTKSKILEKKANLLFMDPPYNQGLILKALEALVSSESLENNAVCVLECEKNEHFILSSSFTLKDERTYGLSKITIAVYSGDGRT